MEAATTLSKREIEILQLLPEGLSSEEIGWQLFISTFTVQTHRRNLMRKLGVNNAQQAIRLAYSQGIVKIS